MRRTKPRIEKNTEDWCVVLIRVLVPPLLTHRPSLKPLDWGWDIWWSYYGFSGCCRPCNPCQGGQNCFNFSEGLQSFPPLTVIVLIIRLTLVFDRKIFPKVLHFQVNCSYFECLNLTIEWGIWFFHLGEVPIGVPLQHFFLCWYFNYRKWRAFSSWTFWWTIASIFPLFLNPYFFSESSSASCQPYPKYNSSRILGPQPLLDADFFQATRLITFLDNVSILSNTWVLSESTFFW